MVCFCLEQGHLKIGKNTLKPRIELSKMNSLKKGIPKYLSALVVWNELLAYKKKCGEKNL